MIIDKAKASAIVRTMETEGWKYIIQNIDDKINFNIQRLENGENGFEVASVKDDENGFKIISINANSLQHEIKFWKDFKRKLEQWRALAK